MRLTSLANLLSGTLSAADYSADISAELAEHTRGLHTGGTARVYATEDMDIVLDRAGLALLCRLFATGQLTAVELAYTADVLQLSDRVEINDQSVANDLAECTDPEINGPLSVARALEIANTGAAA